MSLPKVTQANLIDGINDTTENVSKQQIREIVAALVGEAEQWLSSGFRVDLFGLAIVEPRYVKPIRKGTLVRNPADGEMMPSKGRPAALGAKAKPGSKAKKALASVSLNSKIGKEIAAGLS